MKTSSFAFLTLALLIGLAVAAEPLPIAPGAAPFKDDNEKLSYSIGVEIGRDMKKGGMPINPQVLARGIADGMSGTKTVLTDEEMQAVMKAFDQKMIQDAAARNAKDSDAFLAENAKKPGVKTLPSGLQYKEVKAGDGASPKATDTVTVHYEGTLIDGTVFDSSIKRGSPASFPVNRVIPGWTEALQLMKVGSKWQLFIPAKLAYGEGGTPDGTIGPNSALIFDVELLSVK